MYCNQGIEKEKSYLFLTTVKHCGQLGVVAILKDMHEVHLALSLRKTTQAEENCSAGLATKMSRGTRPP